MNPPLPPGEGIGRSSTLKCEVKAHKNASYNGQGEDDMNFTRKIYDDLPDFIPTPAELKHSRAEVIILPLESSRKEKSTLQLMLAELAAIKEIEPIEMEYPNRTDRSNPFLDED